jgi:hypothetical protein
MELGKEAVTWGCRILSLGNVITHFRHFVIYKLMFAAL